MAQKEYNDQQMLKMLEASVKMYENTKRDTEREMKKRRNEDGTKRYTKEDIDKQIQLIQVSEDEVIEKYRLYGGNPDDLFKRKPKKNIDSNIMDIIGGDTSSTIKLNGSYANTNIMDEIKQSEKKNDYTVNSNTYDVISLPSMGQCYKNKMDKIPVEYLTAYDENIIAAPNLYRDNKIIDIILDRKVMNKVVDPMDMLEGDRDAILIFLRGSGYGNEYPITATDDETGNEFDSFVDLSKLNFKKFKLVGDMNGWFDYTLPVSKQNVKFRFLTHRDNVNLMNIEESENMRLKKGKLEEIIEKLDAYLDNDDDIEKTMRSRVSQSIRSIEAWKDSINEDDDMITFTNSVTNRLELSIMEVDGITDRNYIRKFVMGMNVRDSLALRNYISDNEPGIDYNIEIEKPLSLGGGSMKVFLQLDQYLFLNVPKPV